MIAPSILSPQVSKHNRSSVMQSSHGCSVGQLENKKQTSAMGKLAGPKCEKCEQCWSSKQSWRHSSTEATPGTDVTRLSWWISQARSSMLQAPAGKLSKAREPLANRARKAQQIWCGGILCPTLKGPQLLLLSYLSKKQTLYSEDARHIHTSKNWTVLTGYQLHIWLMRTSWWENKNGGEHSCTLL